METFWISPPAPLSRRERGAGKFRGEAFRVRENRCGLENETCPNQIGEGYNDRFANDQRVTPWVIRLAFMWIALGTGRVTLGRRR